MLVLMINIPILELKVFVQQFNHRFIVPTAGIGGMLMEKIHPILSLYFVQHHAESEVSQTFFDHMLLLLLVHPSKV